LAIGTDSGKIHLLSLAYSQEIELISANETGAAVVAMAGSSVHTMTFASLTRDGNVKIWQRRNEQCTLIGSLSFSSTVISFLGDHFILLAGKDNTLRRFDISSVFEGSESNHIPVYLNVSIAMSWILVQLGSLYVK
jgi:WD40 repeat protein